MNRIPDPLLGQARADRLYYSTGELLGADDFRDEQTYHRRQLAQALLHYNGSGTLSGLRVVARHLPGNDPASDEVQIRVQPGLALDRAGRLIEVPRDACLRLRRWFEFIAAQPPNSAGLDVGDLVAAFHNDTVVADVFLAFHPCDRGYTPAFASGPFDALDASQPSRVRDAYDLTLVLRPEDNPPTAFNPWAAIKGATAEERFDSAIEASLAAWETLRLPPPENVDGWHENPPGFDPTGVLLARLRIPASAPPNAATASTPDWSATAWPDEGANLANTVRNFLFPPAAIHRLLSA